MSGVCIRYDRGVYLLTNGHTDMSGLCLRYVSEYIWYIRTNRTVSIFARSHCSRLVGKYNVT